MSRIALAAAFLFGASSAAAQSRLPGQAEWYHRTDDGVLHYVTEIGQRPTVVVLHGGFGAEHSTLIDAVAPLADRFRFVLYDQRGSLRSPAPDSVITFDRLVSDLEALRVELGEDRLTLLGHSYGTWLAYMYHAAHPNHVRGLALVGPVRVVQETEWPDELVEAVDALGDELNDAERARTVGELAEEGLDGDSLTTDREKVAAWQVRYAGSNVVHVERWRDVRGGMAFFNPNVGRALTANSTQEARLAMVASFFPALQVSGVPVRIVTGAQDGTDPGGLIWSHYAPQLPDAEVVVLDAAGHLPWIDQPLLFSEALAKALQDITSR